MSVRWCNALLRCRWHSSVTGELWNSPKSKSNDCEAGNNCENAQGGHDPSGNRRHAASHVLRIGQRELLFANAPNVPFYEVRTESCTSTEQEVDARNP